MLTLRAMVAELLRCGASPHASASRASPSTCTNRERTGRVAGPRMTAPEVTSKLAAVAVARHRRAVQPAHRKRAPGVGTSIIEGVQMSVRIRHVDLGSRDIEDAHMPCGD